MSKEFTPGKVLVVLGKRGIGDAVEAFPVFEMIKERWPDVELTVGCHARSQELAVDMCHHASGTIRIFKGSVKHKSRAIKGFLSNYRAMNGFDAVLFLYKKKVAWPLVFTAMCTGAKVHHRHDYHYRDSRQSVHSDFPEYVFFQIIASRSLGLPLPSLNKPTFTLSQEDKAFAQDFFRAHGFGDRPAVIINTRDNAMLSEWGIENFADVANALVDGGADVIINGGSKGQLKEYNSVADRLKEGVVLLESPNPTQLASVLERCDLFVGDGSSGPTVLAAALGTPVISLVGSGEHHFPALERAGPVWWPRTPDYEIISKIDWCLVNNGVGCRCRNPGNHHNPARRLLKRAKIWKQYKKLAKWLGIYRKERKVKVGQAPCIQHISAEEVVDAAMKKLGMDDHPRRPCTTQPQETTTEIGKSV